MNRTNQTKRSDGVIGKDLVESIRQRLEKGIVVRQALPSQGFIHIDRQLPFMVLYRRPEKRRDEGTDRLVRGEASYLIVSGGTREKQGLASLLRMVIETLASRNSAFLVIELWSNGRLNEAEKAEDSLVPSFRIIASGSRPPTTTVEALSKALRSVRIQKQRSVVRIELNAKRTSPMQKPLLSVSETRKLNCYFIGLEVADCYRNGTTGEVYPLILRALHRGFSRALKRAFFEFAHSMTTYRPENHHVFGRRAVVRAVWEVDHKLADIDKSFDLILLTTPINIENAWFQFRKTHFERLPVLYYRPLSVDPAVLKRQLYQIQIDHIEDPTLALLFRQKRRELDRRLSMLLDRGKPEFLYGSMQVFGSVDEGLKNEALNILENISPHTHDESMKHTVSAADLAERAREVISVYREIYPALSSSIQVRDDILGLMVSGGNLMIGKNSKVAKSRVDALIHHEVSTHILTYFNGFAQPFHQLYCGLAGYDGLQEGLAVLAEYFVGGLSRSRLRLLAGRVIAAYHLIAGASFVETYRMLNRGYGFNQRTAFSVTMRIYRGGGLTKDAMYLRGLIELLGYLAKGGELEPLYVGKIAIDHIPLIRELQYRQVLKPTPLKPVFLIEDDVLKKIMKLKKGMSPLDLVQRR